MPAEWSGWPEQKRFALVLTHDVEKAKGQERVLALAGIEEALGFRSSFYFVPERYEVSSDIRKQLSARGFEVGVHGLNHDGKLYSSFEVFKSRAARINTYLKEWDAVGFRSPAMHSNLKWLHHLNIEYDASTFDTDPFEPQNSGVRTIYPFWVPDRNGKQGYVELPYTLPHDFTLYVLMQEQNPDIWKKKLDWVANRGGMALMLSHPDYMHFGEGRPGLEEYPVRFYEEFLTHVKALYHENYWNVLPRDLSRFYMQYAMKDKPQSESMDFGNVDLNRKRIGVQLNS